MEMRFILLISVSILQFFSFVSALPEQFCCPRCSKYGLEDNITRVARYLGYDVVTTSADRCNFQKTLDIKSFCEVVINFDVINTEDYDYNYNEDMITDYYGTINKTLTSCTVNENQLDAYNRTCKDPGFNAHTKIFIGSFEKHQALFKVFNTITNNFIEGRRTYYNYKKKHIVICLHNLKSCPANETEGFLIICKRCNTQVECSDNTIAIIAPSPKKLKICDENIPVIFYDTMYVEPNNLKTIYEEEFISDFTTSMTMNHWNELASSLRKYLDEHKWPRVAIVSDDSLLSYHMTNDQSNYFKDTQTVYTIIRDCTEGRDFKQALTFLNKYESKVIIVNVVKQNLNKFIAGARAAGVNDEDIIWVFPGHKQTDDIKDFKFKLFIHLTCDLKEVVQFVIKKYRESFSVDTKFKELIKDRRSWPKTCMGIAESIPIRLPSMSIENCALLTSNYFYYCADWYVMYLILAIIVFLLLVFGILLFFNQIQMNTLAYKPLHKPPSLWRQLLRREQPPPPRQGFPMRHRF